MRYEIPSHTTIWLRAEGLAVLVASVVAYAHHGTSWWLFAGIFFLPDISMLGYLRSAHTGAKIYNTAHTYTLSITFGSVGLAASQPALIAIGLIWTAHIAFDRAMSFGLKERTSFHDTHLGRIGRSKAYEPVA